MQEKDHHRELLSNRLRRIENKLSIIEVLLLKSLKKDKQISREIKLMELEEEKIEKEQKKLEIEEKLILQEMSNLEKEENWSKTIMFNCDAKVLGNGNIINCSHTNRACEYAYCPIIKKQQAD